MRLYKPNETIYWGLSNGDIWTLTPIGLGNYKIETANGPLRDSETVNNARTLVQQLGLTITEES